MGLQKGLILENYATLANVSAWLMIVYFFIVCVIAFALSLIAIHNPENLKYPKKKFVNKVISLLTFAAVIYNAYVLISLEQVFLPIALIVTYISAFAWSKFAMFVYKKQYEEFNK